MGPLSSCNLQDSAPWSYTDPKCSLCLSAPLSPCSAFLQETKCHICFSASLWALTMLVSPLGEREQMARVGFASRDSTRTKRFCVPRVSGFLSEEQPRSPGFLLLGPCSGWGRQTLCFHTERGTYALVTYCKAVFFFYIIFYCSHLILGCQRNSTRRGVQTDVMGRSVVNSILWQMTLWDIALSYPVLSSMTLFVLAW